jgi:diguanylate cyclase (GGDEF)-like protein
MEEKRNYQGIDDYLKLSLFADTDLGSAASNTINVAMNQVMTKIGEIFSPVIWGLLLRNHSTGNLFFKLAHGEKNESLAGKEIPPGKGLANWVMENEKADLIADVTQDDRFYQNLEKITGINIHSQIASPLIVNKEIIGVFELTGRTDGKPYSKKDMNILKTITDFAALTIEKIYYLSAVKDMSHVDALTGVFNRKNFDGIFSREIERCNRYGNPLSVLMVDINNLKTINDMNGDLAGDAVLKDLSLLIKTQIRKVDVVARYGADEFVIILPNTKKHEAENVRQRIIREIQHKNEIREQYPYTVHIGLDAAEQKNTGDLMERVMQDLQGQKNTVASGSGSDESSG